MERDRQIKERTNDFDRRRMDYKRKRTEVIERETIYKQSKSYRDSCARTDRLKRQRSPALKELLTNVADHSRLVVAAGRPEQLASQAELDRVVAEYDFTTYKRADQFIFSEARETLSYSFLTYNCCAVCGCDEPKGDTSFYAVSDESFLLKLSLCIAFTEVNRAQMPEDVQDQYNLRSFDARLDGLILCKFGLYTADHKPLDLSISGSKQRRSKTSWTTMSSAPAACSRIRRKPPRLRRSALLSVKSRMKSLPANTLLRLTKSPKRSAPVVASRRKRSSKSPTPLKTLKTSARKQSSLTLKHKPGFDALPKNQPNHKFFSLHCF